MINGESNVTSCVKSFILNAPKWAKKRRNTISHPAKHVSRGCMRRQLPSICALNVHSFQAHGQVKAQRSRQTASLCASPSHHICSEGSRRSADQIVKWEHLCSKTPDTPAFTQPFIQMCQKRRNHSMMEALSDAGACRELQGGSTSPRGSRTVWCKQAD